MANSTSNRPLDRKEGAKDALDIESILILKALLSSGKPANLTTPAHRPVRRCVKKARVILVNSNPATIMTDPVMADATYIEPVKWQIVEKIIAKERPDAILPTMGGQTALNCALDLNRHGILEK